jgi:hypothetical protein
MNQDNHKSLCTTVISLLVDSDSQSAAAALQGNVKQIEVFQSQAKFQLGVTEASTAQTNELYHDNFKFNIHVL